MTRVELETEVLIVGAGAAGLAAAAELSAAGRSAMLLEARHRIGGRVYTCPDAEVRTHVELGAEFVHGRSKVVTEWLTAIGTRLVDASMERRVHVAGKLVSAERDFMQMKRGLAKIGAPRADLSFAEFLERAPKRVLPMRARELALMIVEGFDAADAARVSTKETLESWIGTAAADAPTFRPRDGYTAVLEAIRSRLDTRRIDLRLKCVVEEIRWRRGRVCALVMQQGRRIQVVSRRIVITLPVGILHLPPGVEGAVRFEPSLTRKRRALAGLAMGPVMKLVLLFSEPFWEEIDGGAYRDVAFFHAPGAAFPTFWASLPERTPLLVGWAAGPRALRLGGLDRTAIVREALDSLEAMFEQRVDAERLLRRSYLHDWQSDPRARGAYSYVVAGGGSARARLAEPIEDTLFFAGEATDTTGESGTVMGALHSGQLAARRILECID